jgi:hypothetical protein
MLQCFQIQFSKLLMANGKYNCMIFFIQRSSHGHPVFVLHFFRISLRIKNFDMRTETLQLPDNINYFAVSYIRTVLLKSYAQYQHFGFIDGKIVMSH